MRASEPASGILVVDKPAGVTSHDVVAGLRRERGCKAGHAGTLDPFATGVLLILLGRATRLQRYLMDLPKTYEATARIGWRSSTGDPDGNLTETGRIPDDLSLPTGRLRQMVPMTSAVRVDGERLYRRAHRGEHDESRPVREIEVRKAELLERSPGEARFRVEVSSGTYVRTLIETLADAYCSDLRRTAVGSIGIDRAGDLLSPREALDFLPEVRLEPQQKLAVGHGQALAAGELTLPAESGGPLALTDGDNLIAVARESGETVRPEVVLEPAP